MTLFDAPTIASLILRKPSLCKGHDCDLMALGGQAFGDFQYPVVAGKSLSTTLAIRISVGHDRKDETDTLTK